MTLRSVGWRGIAALMVALWLVLPVLPLVLWSFAHGWRFPDLWPQDLTLAAWSVALSLSGGVAGSIGVTLWIAGLVTVIAALIGVPAGRALGLYRFRGKAMVELLVLAPVIVPGIVVALGLHGVFLRLHLTNTVAGVVLAHLVPALPYMTLIMAGVFANLDTDAEAQARSLGARPVQVFAHVTLPAILPGLMAACLMTFLVSWGQYVLTLMIGGGRVVTLPLYLYSAASAGRNDVTAAVAILSMLPGLVIVALTARRLAAAGPWSGGRP